MKFLAESFLFYADFHAYFEKNKEATLNFHQFSIIFGETIFFSLLAETIFQITNFRNLLSLIIYIHLMSLP